MPGKHANVPTNRRGWEAIVLAILVQTPGPVWRICDLAARCKTGNWIHSRAHGVGHQIHTANIRCILRLRRLLPHERRAVASGPGKGSINPETYSASFKPRKPKTLHSKRFTCNQPETASFRQIPSGRGHLTRRPRRPISLAVLSGGKPTFGGFFMAKGSPP